MRLKLMPTLEFIFLKVEVKKAISIIGLRSVACITPRLLFAGNIYCLTCNVQFL